MLESEPREKEWVSWLYVVIWSLIIFVTIPLARALQKFVYQQWGRETFTYVVIVAIVIALASSAIYLRRRRTVPRASYLWLLAVATIFIGYTIELRKSPEEAFHFVQYGLLGILVYRALTHRFHDVSIYFAAAIICGIIGIMDETIQWLTPRRFWGLLDIWLNFFAASLVQVGIAKGLNPSIISKRLNRASVRFLCRLAMVAVLLLGANLMNTPQRVSWYAERIPWLSSLKVNESTMLEYGYKYSDPDIGIFYSRISPLKLKQSDQKRGKEAAKILDRFQNEATYEDFLKTYTPITDPFLHEARVHLFRRDRYFLNSAEYKGNRGKYGKYLTVAFRENRIMEKYFPNILLYSAYVWSSDELDLARKHLLKDEVYYSPVSKRLVTRFREDQVAGFFAFLLIGLGLLSWYFGRKN